MRPGRCFRRSGCSVCSSEVWREVEGGTGTYGERERLIVLPEHIRRLSHIVRSIILNGQIVDEDLTLRRVVYPQKQLRRAALPTAVLSDDDDQLPRLDGE